MAQRGVAHIAEAFDVRRTGSMVGGLVGFGIGTVLLAGALLLLTYETLTYLQAKDWESFSVVRLGTIPAVGTFLPESLRHAVTRPEQLNIFRDYPDLLAMIDAVPAWILFAITGFTTFRKATR